MAYCGWPTLVNKLILDSTTVTVGENATIQDTLEAGGIPKSRLTSSHPADKFSVVMEFDFSETQSNGYTEIENFWAWYKTVHKYGTVPFQFPAILINSNRMAGLSVEDRGYAATDSVDEDDTTDKEYYKIISAVEGSKNGLCQQVKMTWQTYATGVIQVTDSSEDFEVDHIEATNGSIEVVMDSTPSYEPNSATWTVTYTLDDGDETELTITNCMFDGDVTATLYFDEFTDAGTYQITVGTASDSFVIV